MPNENRLEALKEILEMEKEGLITREEKSTLKAEALSWKRTELLNLPDGLYRLLGTIVWSALLIAFLVAFREPITQKLKDASKVTLFNFSIEVEKKLKESGNARLAKALKGLSKDAAETLLNSGKASHYLVSRDASGKNMRYAFRFQGAKELQKLGLLSASRKIDDFEAWVTSLPGNSSTTYLSANGSTSDLIPSGDYKTIKVFSMPVSKLSEDQLSALRDMHFRLSSKGEKLWDLINQVVVDSLVDK